MPALTLIFDLDGTLVDTAPDLLGALNVILRQEGRSPVDHSAVRHLVGHGARVMLETAFQMTGAPVEPARLPALFDDYIAHYKSHVAVASVPFPGVEATLEQLRTNGARLGVLTNKPQELADLLLKDLNLTRFFDAIYGAGRMSYTKPDARIFHDVVRDTAGGPVDAIMVGDSITDVETARAANAKVILVDYGYTPEPAETLGADAVTGDFTRIPALAAALT
ncbi:MAG TPA: HAD-IA family hydrolase [Rhizomicrobium sp.]|jgi:phosphoglycolate phosphatase